MARQSENVTGRTGRNTPDAPGKPTEVSGPDPDQALAALLPVIGPAFGGCVLILGAWDFVAGSSQSPASLLLRLLLVALGAPAYTGGKSGWTPLQRCALIYATHDAALATTAGSLVDGLKQAMPLLAVSMLLAGLIEIRPARCLRILIAPYLLYGVLGALSLPPALWLPSAAVCLAPLLLATMISAANGRLHHQAWQREQALLHACHYDSLSGAMSRAYLAELARHDLALARRYGRPLAVAMIDIDYFKRVNDTCGHAAGDDVIRALVRTCMQELRASDYVGRIGGEEFVCVMPETKAAEAYACAERIRQGFARLRMAFPSGPLSVTISIGVTLLADQADWDELLRHADAAMYRAKEGGRNRTILAGPSMPGATA